MSRTVNGRQSLIRDVAVGVGLAATVFALSYADGGFAPTTRAYAGMAAWWLLGVGAAFGIASAWSSIDRLAVIAVGLFVAFAVWVLISVRWAADAERAFAQFNQVALYVAVFAIAIVLARLVPVRVLTGGVAVALVCVAVVAFVSRCLPSTWGVDPGGEILQQLSNGRLSFPLGYWNGLGIEVALAYPLLLALMTSRRSRVASTLAALPLPILAAVMYLTSSRGAFVAAAIAVVMFVLLTPRRWGALAAVAVAGCSGAVAVGVLVPKKVLVNGDMGIPLGVQQGHHAAFWVGVTCVVTALGWLGLTELGKRLPAPSRLVGRVTAGVLVTLVLVAIVVGHPIRQFDAFRSNPAVGHSHGTPTTNHLLSTSGSGRWQFWTAAISEFKAHPLNGGGAGSWLYWWLEHPVISAYTQYAHSLYLESLAELGIVGLLLIAAAVIVAVAGAVRSALRLESGDVAAAAACGIAFFAAAAYDWVWQLAGIAIVGVGMLGFALGALPSTRASAAGRLGVLRPAIALVAVAAIIPQYVVLAAGSHLRDSQAAFRANNGDTARSEALAAKALEPWAASPYLQLGFVSEGEGHFDAAARWLDKAIERSRDDWNLWLVKARIETERGNAAAALRDLAEAKRLNPTHFEQGS